jgi:undecaprenyl pyrophosphate synthase
MLWQTIGTKVLWSDRLWPEIGEADLDAALALAAAP